MTKQWLFTEIEEETLNDKVFRYLNRSTLNELQIDISIINPQSDLDNYFAWHGWTQEEFLKAMEDPISIAIKNITVDGKFPR